MNTGVSVIIPVYNGQAFIRRAVDSVLGQTHSAAEIIIVNDGSVDRTLDELAGYGSRVRVITTSNRGVSSARNTGFAASTSSLIAFLDADDEWHDDKLARQVAVLERHPHAGLCCCDYAINDGVALRETTHFSLTRERIGGEIEQWSHAPLLSLVHGNFVGTTSTVLVRRAALNAAGVFHSRYKQAEDYDLWIRLARVTGFHVMPDVLLTKIGHESNLTNNQIEMFTYHEAVLEAHVDTGTFRFDPSLQREALFALATTRYQLANLLFEAGQYRDSRSYYGKALRTQNSVKNLLLFTYFASRKLGRIVSLGTLRPKPV
jgi:glycosyltransferase involved in cell wall biosynthesis